MLVVATMVATMVGDAATMVVVVTIGPIVKNTNF